VQLSFTQLLKTKSNATVLVNRAEKDFILIKAVLGLTTDLIQPLHYFFWLKRTPVRIPIKNKYPLFSKGLSMSLLK
jgi:hypothetical protein